MPINKTDLEDTTSRLSDTPSSCAIVASDDFDLREIWRVIWQGKWIIMAFTAVFVAISAVYAVNSPNIYISKALLAPSGDAQSGGVSRMAGQLGGLASLAGIDVGGSRSDKIDLAMAVLKSREFITGFVERHSILADLMAVEGWDKVSGELIFDSDVYQSTQGVWIRDVPPPKMPQPSLWEAFNEFSKILSVSKDKDTGFVTVAVEHPSPLIAQQWVAWLVEDVNAVMKAKDVREATRSIEFLKGQLDIVALADMRTVFYQLIEEQTKTVMLAQVRDQYVFSYIDPPFLAEEKSKPHRSLIIFLSLVVGVLVGVVVILTHSYFRKFLN